MRVGKILKQTLVSQLSQIPTSITHQDPFSLDIDECADENTKCEDGKYCANNPGSFACVNCDQPCSQCSGPGTEKCTACSSGFQLTEKGCEGLYILLTEFVRLVAKSLLTQSTR